MQRRRSQRAARDVRRAWPNDQRLRPRHLHRVTNAGPDPAVSLHVYAPKLTVMTNYARGAVLAPVEQSRDGVDW